MAFIDCLATAVDGKEISQAEADRLFASYERYRKAGGDAAGAKKQLEADLKKSSLRRKRLAFLAAQNLAQIEGNIAKYLAGGKKPEIGTGEAVIRMLEHFGDGQGFASVSGLQKAILGISHSRIEAVLHEFRRDPLLGDNLNLGKLRLSFRKNQARLANVVKEAFDEDSGDAVAKALFKAWYAESEYLRQRFNALGGEIPRLEYGYLPQSHDRLAVLRAEKEPWKAFIKPLLAWDRMKHPVTGGPILDIEQDEVLESVYDAIVTAGWSKREPSRARVGRGALANQYAEHRFLQFDGAEKWGLYQREFGEGDPFVAMMEHVNMMARDIATLQVLGPNPTATMEYLKQRMLKASTGAGKETEAKVGSQIRHIEAVFASIRGDLETPVNAVWADVFAGARNWITSSVLGGAAVSAISDLGFQQMARAFNGIPSTGVVIEVVNQLRKEPSRIAVRSGLILDAAVNTFHRQARYIGSMGGPQWTSYLADRTLTLSALSPWTQAGKHAFGMSIMGEVGEQAGRAFGDLHPKFRAMFERWGFSAADWDAIRAVQAYDPIPGSGATFIRPSDMADRRLAERYLEMILQETEYAVPSFSHRGKAVFIKDRPGTVQGEFWRSGFQFKGFGATLAILQGTRIGMEAARGGKLRGGLYAAKLFITATVWGALALQLKQLAAGRDPRQMGGEKTLEFWGAAALQGGGFGLFGDFLFADLNRFGGGLATTITGPLVGHAWDAWQLTAGNVMQIANGDDPKAGREAVTFIKGNVPLSTLWFLRLPYERAVLDNLQRMVDPEADKSFKAKIRTWQRDTGQEFFWAPGTSAPQRGPDISAAVTGGSP